MSDCSCPRVRAGNYLSPARAWNDCCPEHGVGTSYFRKLPQLPFGYRGERNTTREQWLALQRQPEENDHDEDAD